MLKLLNKLLRIFYRLKNYINPYCQASYSQEGEDCILMRIFENQPHGFYVDIGAHHPERFSNTKIFYDRGWCGINVDPMPNSMKVFYKRRKRDINLELGIGPKGTLEYYIFNEKALNTFNKSNAIKYQKYSNNYTIESIEKVKLITLECLFEEYLDKGSISVDFMSIDVEGFELDVIKSNNWNKFRPKIILIEALDVQSIEEHISSELNQYFTDIGYKLYCKTKNTIFYKNVGVANVD